MPTPLLAMIVTLALVGVVGAITTLVGYPSAGTLIGLFGSMATVFGFLGYAIFRHPKRRWPKNTLLGERAVKVLTFSR